MTKNYLPASPIVKRTKLRCPVCEHPSAVISEREDGIFWLICFPCRDVDGLDGGDWLRAVVSKTDAPDGGALLQEPYKYLNDYILEDNPSGNGGIRRKGPAPLPTWKQIGSWQHELKTRTDRCRYLAGRGINFPLWDKWHIGWYDGSTNRSALKPYADKWAFALPVFDNGGELVNVIRRFYPRLPKNDRGKDVPYIGLRGRPHALYPDIPQGRSVLLVAGMFDALLGRAKGLPTVTATNGTGFGQSLAAALVGKRVAVLFDVGEEKAAERVVNVLRAEGVRAWFVPNRLPEEGDDLTDWFVKYALSRDWLLEDIRKAKRRS